MNTKEMFYQALERLLQTRTIEEITASDIICESGLGRTTFYSHFTDKYNLLCWHFATAQNARLRQLVDDGASYRTCIEAGLEEYSRAKNLYSNALGNLDYYSLQSYIERFSVDYFAEILERHGADLDTPDKQLLLSSHIVSSHRLLLQWIRGEVDLPVKELADIIVRMVPAEFVPYIG